MRKVISLFLFLVIVIEVAVCFSHQFLSRTISCTHFSGSYIVSLSTLPTARLSQSLSANADDNNDNNDDISNIPQGLMSPGDKSLDSLFNAIKDIDPEDVPQDMQDAIRQKIEQNQPSDLQIRLNLMGFNPLTVAGYALAAVILTCNTVFGTGWAGDLLGMNEVITSDRTQTIQPRFTNNYDGIERQEIQTFELNNKENLL